jgi:hypothetical protein
MAYSQADPRSRLAAASAPSAAADGYGTPSYAKFYETEPQLRADGAATWLARGQHFVLGYSQVSPGAVLWRPAQHDEYALLIPEAGVSAEVTVGEESLTVPGRTLTFIPPGRSAVRALSEGRLIRVLTSAAADLAEASSNAAAYQTAQPNIAPLAPWPLPVGGYRLRSYQLDVAPEPGRFGRIWRCTTLMVNYTEPRPGPRDVTRMSPHVHEDFEQASLVLDGSFVHHIRRPWSTDLRQWVPDEHEICAGPSLTVIPPLTVHTSQQVGTGINQLVDIFAPPRVDFSSMDGWVLNASDYPMPARQQKEAS